MKTESWIEHAEEHQVCMLHRTHACKFCGWTSSVDIGPEVR